jgi:hypothetical protein
METNGRWYWISILNALFFSTHMLSFNHKVKTYIALVDLCLLRSCWYTSVVCQYAYWHMLAEKRAPIILLKLEPLKSCFLHCYREDSEILGSHLLIHGVRKEDFGQYTCQISNTWFQSVDTSVWLREIGKERLCKP